MDDCRLRHVSRRRTKKSRWGVRGFNQRQFHALQFVRQNPLGQRRDFAEFSRSHAHLVKVNAIMIFWSFGLGLIN